MCVFKCVPSTWSLRWHSGGHQQLVASVLDLVGSRQAASRLVVGAYAFGMAEIC